MGAHSSISQHLQKSNAKTSLASHYRMYHVQSCIHVLLWCKWLRSFLPVWIATCLHFVPYTSLLLRFSHTQDPAIQMQDTWCFLFCFGPDIWNSLPLDLRYCSALFSFVLVKTKLKTFLFSQYFYPSWNQHPVSSPLCVRVHVCAHCI